MSLYYILGSVPPSKTNLALLVFQLIYGLVYCLHCIPLASCAASQLEHKPLILNTNLTFSSYNLLTQVNRL